MLLLTREFLIKSKVYVRTLEFLARLFPSRWNIVHFHCEYRPRSNVSNTNELLRTNNRGSINRKRSESFSPISRMFEGTRTTRIYYRFVQFSLQSGIVSRDIENIWKRCTGSSSQQAFDREVLRVFEEMNRRNLERNKVRADISFRTMETTFLRDIRNFVSEENREKKLEKKK